MPRIARKNLIGNLFVHNMVQGINKEYIFQNTEDKLKYMELMKKYNEKIPIRIIAYCIMDNHVHLLIYSENIQYVSKFMKNVNLLYAMYYNKKYERVGYVFRNRFEDRRILNEKNMLNCIKYIHMNPVKAHITQKESEYLFSSYKDYINKTNFVNSELLNFLFNSEKDYLEKFLSIKYHNMNLEVEKVDLKNVLKDFLKIKEFSKEEMITNSLYIKKFINYLTENEYAYTKVELASVLGMSRANLYRRLEENTDEKY